MKMRGGIKSKIHSRPTVSPASNLVRRQAEFLPDSWDWRNVSGVNYVPAVRNQGACGSCYAFSATAMVESRIRVATKNDVAVTLSPQDIVSCSDYSQGCEGGFPYLIGGKYAQVSFEFASEIWFRIEVSRTFGLGVIASLGDNTSFFSQQFRSLELHDLPN